MSNIFQLLISGIFEIISVLVIIGLFGVIANTFYKPEYIKNKVNLTIYIIIGLVVCFSIAYYFSSDNTPPCLNYEYDTMGGVCVEYNDTTIPQSYLDIVKQSSKIFSIGFLTFLAFVYLKKKYEEEKFPQSSSSNIKPIQVEDPKEQDQPKKKLMFMVNTEGKTPEQMKKESWEAFQKFKKNK